MDDDFNTGGAIGELFEIVHALNRFANSLPAGPGALSAGQLAEYRAGMIVLKELCQILGLFKRPQPVPEPADHALNDGLMTLLVDLRDAPSQGEELRPGRRGPKAALGLGVTLEDRPDGTRWRVEPRALTA